MTLKEKLINELQNNINTVVGLVDDKQLIEVFCPREFGLVDYNMDDDKLSCDGKCKECWDLNFED